MEILIVRKNNQYVIVWANDDTDYFTIIGSTSVTPGWNSPGSPLKYKLGDNGRWTESVSGISISTNDIIRFRGTGRTSLFLGTGYPWRITGSDVIITGNMNTLLDYINPPSTIGDYCFSYMFNQQISIKSVYATLPADTLGTRCYYSMFRECINLVDAPALPATTLAYDCYAYMFYRCTNLVDAPELPATSVTAYCYSSMFNSCTSLINAPVLPAISLQTNCYNNMFYSCSNLVNAPELPATTLAPGCYQYMFAICNSLITAPALPATTLADQCYFSMFAICTGLVNAPALPATTLANNCYVSMFNSCTSLLNAPGNDRYTAYSPAQVGMFSGCTKVENSIPYCEIPSNFGGPSTPSCPFVKFTNATSVTPKWTVAGSALQYKIGTGNWINATSGSSIPVNDGNVIRFRGTGRIGLFTSFATSNAWTISGTDVVISGNMNTLLNYSNPPSIIGAYAYDNLFFNCNSIKTVNAILPSMTLSDSCYRQMFGGCTNLITPPDLPATSLAEGCYNHMFQNCTSLINAPDLPASTLTEYCYYNMFLHCTNLVNAPVLNAQSLARACYSYMFGACTSLVNAPVLPATTLVDYCYQAMFYGCTNLVNAPGNDVYTSKTPTQADMFSDCTKVENSIPYCEIPQPFGGPSTPACSFITISNATSVTPRWTSTGTALEYKMGTNNWANATSGSAISVTAGAKIRFRGSGRNRLFTGDVADNVWSISGSEIAITGNMNTLLDYKNPPITVDANCFNNMFNARTNLKTVTATLPATTLGSNAYLNMFNGCTGLTTVPSSLPANVLGVNCYQSMFRGCIALVNIPTFNATSLNAGCYNQMFSGCTSLINAPSLPATTLQTNCYQNMFNGCTNLITATGNDRYTNYSPAQAGMFTGCTKVENSIPYCEIPASFGGGGNSNCPFITIIDATSVTPKWTTSGSALQYKLGTGNWSNATNKTAISTGGAKIRFRGSGRTGLFTADNTSDNPWIISGSGVTITGNMHTLLDYNNPPSTIAAYCFASMFRSNGSIKTVSITLPAMTLPTYAYNAMFWSCENLITGPSLPATTLGTYCYNSFFGNCTNLTSTPVLNATALASNCYSSMFSGCIKLVDAPALPATTLASGCYQYMFSGCTNLVNAPGNDVYTGRSPAQAGMFSGCTKVENSIPYCEIPASFGGGGNSNCPFITISNATSVTPKWTTSGSALQYKIGTGNWTNAASGTVVSVTGGAKIRFRGSGRTSLFTSVVSSNHWIIAGTNVDITGNMNALLDYNNPPSPIGAYAFNYMFQDCTSIKTFNATLPATGLNTYCYAGMLESCTGLTSAPLLPATKLVEYCYYGMFYRCTSLVATPSLPATTLQNGCYSLMFYGCTNLVIAKGNDLYTTYTPAQAGMFTDCTKVENSIPYCEIPSNFGGPSTPVCPFVTFSNVTSITPKWDIVGTSFEYSLNGGAWTSVSSGTPITTSGNPIRFRGSGRNRLFTDGKTSNAWDISGTDVVITGNMNTLLDYNNPPSRVSANCFSYMFYNCTRIKTFNAALPATTLDNYCYYFMFYNCTSLLTAPVLPATTLAAYCYNGMFGSCTSLVNAPALPATSLADNCYGDMFYNCTSLLTAPALPATSLAAYCYYGMFYSCTNLLIAPALPADTLASYCYANMFIRCTKLPMTPTLNANTLVDYCYMEMFSGCVNLTTAPNCNVYTQKSPSQYRMFYQCTRLTSPMTYANIPSNWK